MNNHKKNEKMVTELVRDINLLLKPQFNIKIKITGNPPIRYKHIIQNNVIETPIVEYIKDNRELINILNSYLFGLKHCYRLKNNNE